MLGLGWFWSEKSSWSGGFLAPGTVGLGIGCVSEAYVVWVCFEEER